MKNRFLKSVRALILLNLVVSCGSSEQILVNTDKVPSIKEFGYSAFHPVQLGAPTDEAVNFKITNYLHNLRSEEGSKLEIVSRSQVDNPNYKEPKIKIYDIFTNEIINKKSSKLLEVYTLKPYNEKDTLKIYFDPFINGQLMVPSGLNFASTD